jgi:hypothetical protein
MDITGKEEPPRPLKRGGSNFRTRLDNNETLDTEQATVVIRAHLIGSRICGAMGIRVNAYAPVCELARRLLRARFHPDQMVEVYRGETLCFRVKLITAARLIVDDSGSGRPSFKRWREAGAASSIAQNGSGVPRQPPGEKAASAEVGP